jgi:DNA-binding SARP family transcriptional activator
MASSGDQQRIAVRLLPDFELAVAGARVVLPTSAQRIIAYAAVAQRQVSRVAVAGLIWPELPAERSAASLRSTLWQIRRRAPGAVCTDAQGVWLGVDVDVDYAHAIETARGHGELSAEALQHDLLVEWGDEWVLMERERYRQLRLHALEQLCRRLVSVGETCAAIEVALSAVNSDPLRETGQRALIEAHLADGNVSEAIRQYRAFESILAVELGVAPTTGLSALVGIRSALPVRR